MKYANLNELLESEYSDVVLIGTENEREKYFPAIMRIDGKSRRAIYDRDALVECFMNSDEMTYEEADEWVSYNIERAIPYWGEHAPIIVDYSSLDESELDEEEIERLKFLNS